jgi:hypothetical protein
VTKQKLTARQNRIVRLVRQHRLHLTEAARLLETTPYKVQLMLSDVCKRLRKVRPEQTERMLMRLASGATLKQAAAEVGLGTSSAWNARQRLAKAEQANRPLFLKFVRAILEDSGNQWMHVPDKTLADMLSMLMPQHESAVVRESLRNQLAGAIAELRGLQTENGMVN